MSILTNIFRDRSGAGTIEYALVASLISVAAIAGYQNVGSKVQNGLTDTHQAVASNL